MERDLDALFAGELAAFPLRAANARVELDRDVRHEHEIIETIVRVETLRGVHGDRDQARAPPPAQAPRASA